MRGVVTTCCYIARMSGVRSAMPMFKARKLCPEAVILPPNFAKYRTESGRIMEKLRRVTPLVQPLSLDEAWLDLSGTERLHRATPAVTLARLQAEIERDVGITVSIGLAANKFLAKIASDLDKPRGFAVIGGRGSRGVPGAAAGRHPARRRPGFRADAGERRLRHGRRPRRGRAEAAGRPLRRPWATPASAGAWPRRARRQSTRTAQGDVGRDHLRRRTSATSPSWRTCSGRSARRSPVTPAARRSPAASSR